MVKFEIKSNLYKPVIDKRHIDERFNENIRQPLLMEGKNVLDELFKNYLLVLELPKEKQKVDNWYKLCGVILRKMSKDTNGIIKGATEKERLEVLEEFLIEHMVDSLMMNEKIDLLNYIYANKEIELDMEDNTLKRVYVKTKKYLLLKLIVSRGVTGIVLYDGPSSVTNLNVFVVNQNDMWELASPEDKRQLEGAIEQRYRLNVAVNLNTYVGFIGFETNKKYMVYKLKDTTNKRSTGFRCDQAGKKKTVEIVKILNKYNGNVGEELDEDDSDDEEKVDDTQPVTGKKEKEGSKELCVRQEFILRSFNKQKLNGQTWFLDTETAIYNEFEKKEKPTKL
jgi:hypothetical protein